MATAPIAATATSRAIPLTALFTPDARQARAPLTDPSTAVDSGTTTIAMLHPASSIGGITPHETDCVPTSMASPTWASATRPDPPAIGGPGPMRRHLDEARTDEDEDQRQRRCRTKKGATMSSGAHG